jgi:NADH-quinone oxidoreductase subunit E
MSSSKTVNLPPQPEGAIPAAELLFTVEELAQIEQYKSRYAEVQAAVMPVLWLAQEKFGYLPPEVVKLVAETLEMPYSHVYGVATFYTQYYKEKVGTHLLDMCTCFSCQVVGGYDMLHHVCEKLGIHEGETTEDGMFTVREAECLGACGSGPMLQVTNGPYVFNLTPEKLDALLESLRAGEMPEFVSITLPQDEDEMGGNRRTDVDPDCIGTYQTPAVAEKMS